MLRRPSVTVVDTQFQPLVSGEFVGLKSRNGSGIAGGMADRSRSEAGVEAETQDRGSGTSRIGLSPAIVM